MAVGLLRFQSGVTNVSSAATVIAHGLPGTPTEYGWAPWLAGTGGVMYFLGVSSTNLVVAAAVGGASGQIIANIPHTFIA
jgi:hypothetical protein